MKTCDCSFSTGICGSITKGHGRLDFNGYWEFPCDHDPNFPGGIELDKPPDRTEGE